MSLRERRKVLRYVIVVAVKYGKLRERERVRERERERKREAHEHEAKEEEGYLPVSAVVLQLQLTEKCCGGRERERLSEGVRESRKRVSKMKGKGGGDEQKRRQQ